MKDKIEAALDQLRPKLQADGGDIALQEITEDNVVKVRFQGACSGCPGAAMTFKFYIERELKAAVPEIKEVVLV